MHKLNRQDAEDIAEQVTQMLQPMIKRGVADLLASEDEDGLTEAERAKVGRAVASRAARCHSPDTRAR